MGIVGKKQNGKVYYYLTESARVNGKPRIVSQRYLGSAEEVEARLAEAGPGEPDRTRHLAFGDLAAVWSILERLDVIDIIDDVVGARRGDAAGTVGTYVALACANRIVDPCSKRRFVDWWKTTAGDRWVRLPTAALDHRRFWDAMDAISAEDLETIEARITARMVTEFGVDVSGLVLDMTNFATYIDTANERAPIAQRGHAKQKRTDLRLVGLGLIVSTDAAIPLLSHTYAGNRPDVTQFAAMVTSLTDRLDSIGADTDNFTLVYDAGQNSGPNQHTITASPLHFVGSLPPSDHSDLLAVAHSSYQPVDGDRFPGLTAYATTKTVYGATHSIVITHSQNLHDKQSRGFDQTMAKARRQLTDLAARLARGRTRRTRDKVEAEITQILGPRWLNRVITTTLTGEDPTEFRLRWRTKPAARHKLETELFGKRILFTDRHHWPAVDIVTAYRSQSHVEADFRQMKDPHVVSFSPMHHWTDSKIRVHAFYCVLALTTARLMAREADHAGHHMSVPELLDTLAGIQETVLLYQGDRGRPRARRMLTETSPTQQALHDLFNLDTYAPTR
jgi:transposase